MEKIPIVLDTLIALTLRVWHTKKYLHTSTTYVYIPALSDLLLAPITIL
jgi:hypothetical protein